MKKLTYTLTTAIIDFIIITAIIADLGGASFKDYLDPEKVKSAFEQVFSGNLNSPTGEGYTLLFLAFLISAFLLKNFLQRKDDSTNKEKEISINQNNESGANIGSQNIGDGANLDFSQNKTTIIHNHPEKEETPETKILTPLSYNLQETVGREEELKEIRQNFETSSFVLLLNGLGGMGKRLLAKHS